MSRVVYRLKPVTVYRIIRVEIPDDESEPMVSKFIGGEHRFNGAMFETIEECVLKDREKRGLAADDQTVSYVGDREDWKTFRTTKDGF